MVIHTIKKNYDEARDKFLRNLNIETLRISTEEIVTNLNKVNYEINKFIEVRKISLFKGKAGLSGKGLKKIKIFVS